MKTRKKKIAIGIITLLAVILIFVFSAKTPHKNSVPNSTFNAETSENEITASNVPFESEQEQSDAHSKNSDNTQINVPKENRENVSGKQTSEASVSPAKDAPSSPGSQQTNLPAPSEPEDTPVTDKKLTCTLSVRCDTILNNMDMLTADKESVVPADGVIFSEKTVSFYEGESVFNLLLREMKANKIHMEFVNTPIYNSAYIEGIGNLYEFDCGELSGWMYRVNGVYPNYGCSRYKLKAGDKVEWVYTCDLGKDVGGDYSTENGR